MEVSEPVVSLGSMPANDAVIAAPDVSRRHAAIVNLRDEVWVYDLGSTYGTRVDGAVVEGRRFLDGVHRISLGSREVEVGARADLLV
jgi:pSer/pThr/pTyr-binding forkhead associated (FHA) protein